MTYFGFTVQPEDDEPSRRAEATVTGTVADGILGDYPALMRFTDRLERQDVVVCWLFKGDDFVMSLLGEEED